MLTFKPRPYSQAHCHDCGAPMWLMTISPLEGDDGTDQVTYHCALCNDTHIEIRRTPGPLRRASSKKVRQARA
jgi:hypothetical protein